MLTVARYITIMLCALALALGLTQALAAAPSPMLFNAVSALLSAAALSALSLAILLRQRAGFALADWGTLLLALAGVLWTLLIVPGRQPEWLVAMISAWPAPTGTEVRQWLRDRDSAFVPLSAWLVGFSLVVLSAIRRPVLRRGPRGPLPLVRRIIS
jgi:hypothetical protein